MIMRSNISLDSRIPKEAETYLRENIYIYLHLVPHSEKSRRQKSEIQRVEQQILFVS